MHPSFRKEEKVLENYEAVPQYISLSRQMLLWGQKM